jgi:hypothetical protein
MKLCGGCLHVRFAFSSVASAAVTSSINPAVGGVLVTGVVGNAIQAGAEFGKASVQRGLELENLGLAIGEANEAKKVADKQKDVAEVADKQKDVAEKASIVAGLQRQAALLRHEFAIQNLEFLRNRVLSAEQWYRLVAASRIGTQVHLRA